MATFYVEYVPPLVRTGVSNFFGNMSDVWSAINSLLQGRLQDAEENFARFHINTMFGVRGIFDVASEFNIERHREDFGQTLGRWGVPAGPYLVILLLRALDRARRRRPAVDRRYDLGARHQHPTRATAFYVARTMDRRANLLRVGQRAGRGGARPV